MSRLNESPTQQKLANMTEAAISRLVGPTVLERGLTYFEDGMVKRLTWCSDGSLAAKVEGTSEPYYDVTIQVETNDDWKIRCTCPYDQGICKHVAAVMLAAAKQLKETRGTGKYTEKKLKRSEPEDEPITEETLQNYLTELPKEELVQLLLQQAEQDDRLYERLALKASRVKRKAIGLSSYRQRIRETLSWHGFVEYGEVPSFTKELEAVAASLHDLIQEGYGLEAAGLIEQLIDGCTRRLEELDDSDGIFSDFVTTLYQDWGNALAKVADRNRTELASQILRRIEQDDYGLTDELVPAMSEALGEEGLAAIEAAIRPKYEERLRSAPSKANKSDFDADLAAWRGILQDIADARKDIERYTALCQDDELSSHDCLEIAKRLKAAGRLKEALAMVERGLKLGRGLQGIEELELPDLRIELLGALGQSEQARQAAWEAFCQFPYTEALDRLLKLTPKERRSSVRQAAIEHVLSKGELSEAIEVCLHERELLPLAARILKMPKEVYRLGYGELLPAARALEPIQPEAAVLIYRHLAFQILREKRSAAYHHALDYFRALQRLYSHLGKQDTWSKLAARVKAAHKRKYSFIKPFEQLCAGGAPVGRRVMSSV